LKRSDGAIRNVLATLEHISVVARSRDARETIGRNEGVRWYRRRYRNHKETGGKKIRWRMDGKK